MTTETDWEDEAQCKGMDTELFYRNADRAKRVCNDCPVRRDCFMYAVAHRERYGVWGGTSKDQRAELSREQRDLIRRTWYSQHPRRR